MPRETVIIECTEARYAYKYRCVLTGNDGTTLTTDEVRMVNPLIIVDGVSYQKLTDTTVAIVGYSGSATSIAVPARPQKTMPISVLRYLRT